jgi:hypothetical protein
MANLSLKHLAWRLSLSMILLLSTLGLAPGQRVPKPRLDTMPRQYAGPHLLRDLAADLTAKFGWRISIEEPPWVMSQGAGLMFPSQRRLPPELRNSTMNLPEGKLDLKDVLTANYDSAQKLIQACLFAYSNQGNQGGYLVRASKGMLQVVPDPKSPAVQISGQSLLDSVIEVPVEMRFAREHFEELCKAVQHTSGVACVGATADMRFDETYLASFRKRVKWGCSKMKARSALEDYLSHSLTTMTWQLMCQPKEAGDRVCVLFVS